MAEPGEPDDGNAPATTGGAAPGPPPRQAPVHMLARTALLVLAIALLFPRLLGWATHGAWPAFVLGLGMYRWAAWGACFIAMTLLRFSNLPRRSASPEPPAPDA